ncbi:MAG: 3-dehydroquinate synthase [Planctomycetes bacterium]|nr:3-dehydroquinate synthase [Planctomycetota bacterium]
MPEALVRLADRSYPVVVEWGSLARLGSIAAGHRGSARLALVTDSGVDRLLGGDVERSLSSAGLHVRRVVVPAGEATKSLTQVESLCRAFAAHAMDRASLVVALGGGVVTDLAGFAAASYLRGVAWIAVPTTLQGQLDAAIGGKTGVNVPEGKNLVGAFHQPLAVVADPGVLRTLPDEELRSGLAEAVKCGVIGDADLFALLERRAADALAREPRAIEDVVFKSAKLKADVVSEDEREGGRRAILNFGHTIGHAIEAASGYGAYRHGEAVAIGMVAACRLACEATGFTPRDEERVRRLLESLGLPIRLRAPLDRAVVHAAMSHDKKRIDGRVRFVLPEAIGRVRTGVAVDEGALNAVLREVGC